jgi:hypothetical protein
VPTNLFDLIDSLFKGIVAAIYSLVATIWYSLIHPWTAPSKLTRDYRDSKVQQLSSVTILSIMFFLSYSLSTDIVFNDNLISRFYDKSWTEIITGRDTPKIVVTTFISSILAATIVDASIRVLLRLFSTKSFRSRLICASIIEYSFVGPLAYLSLSFATINYILSLFTQGNYSFVIWVFTMTATIASISSASLQIRRIIRPLSRYNDKLIISVILSFIVSFTVLTCAFLGGSALLDNLDNNEIKSAKSMVGNLTLLNASCKWGVAPRLILLLSNDTTKVQVIDIKKLYISAVRRDNEGRNQYSRSYALNVVDPIQIWQQGVDVGRSVAVTMDVDRPDVQDWSHATTCHIEAESSVKTGGAWSSISTLDVPAEGS